MSHISDDEVKYVLIALYIIIIIIIQHNNTDR